MLKGYELGATLGIVICLAALLLVIVALVNATERIAKEIKRSNELKEKELKAKYPDMDMQ